MEDSARTSKSSSGNKNNRKKVRSSPSCFQTQSFPCWNAVAIHLTLEEFLAVRLTCKAWHAGVQEQLGPELLAHAWLSPFLQQPRCNAYLLGNSNIDQHWRLATNQGKLQSLVTKVMERQRQQPTKSHTNNHDKEEEDDDDDEEDGMPSLARALRVRRSVNNSNSNNKTSVQLFFQIIRILNYLPMELAVAFSGKYGRQAIPIRPTKNDDSNNNNNMNMDHKTTLAKLLQPEYYFHRCRRRVQGGPCPTCQYSIPRRSRQRRDEEGDDNNNNDKDILHQTFAIAVDKGRQFLDLRECHPRCFPNLPQFLSCPYCDISDRQTLVLSDLCYESEAGTEKPKSHQMNLTFTPAAAATASASVMTDQNRDDSCEEEEKDHKKPAAKKDDDVFASIPRRPTKRARQERANYQRRQQQQQHEHEQARTWNRNNPTASSSSSAAAMMLENDTKETFPPRYREMCVPGLEQEHTNNAKYGITIYCTVCREFALIAPAGLCHSNSRHHNSAGYLSEFEQLGRRDDEEEEDHGSDSEHDDSPPQTMWNIDPPRPRGEPPFVMGGMLQRQVCGNRSGGGHVGRGTCRHSVPCTICQFVRKTQVEMLVISSNNSRCMAVGPGKKCLTCHPLMGMPG